MKLVSVWKETVRDVLVHLENLIYDPEGVVAFNISFDWFHVCQMYTTLLLMNDWDALLEDCIEEYALKEPKARFGPCVKPVSACDLMLHARKGPYQSTMEREDIRIKRVPTALAWQLAAELENRLKFKDIYFIRRPDGRRWNVYDLEDPETGRINPDFKDIVLKFAPSSALKALAADALNIPADDIILFHQIDMPRNLWPQELGYAPFALAIGEPSDWKGAWPEVLRHHISHWSYHQTAREYAKKDVHYLQRLYPHFGSPELGDDDSVLACMVAAVRWRGYSVNLNGLRKLRDDTKQRNVKVLSPQESRLQPFLDNAPGLPGQKLLKIPTAPHVARKYITAALGEMECEVLDGSTKKPVLEAIAKWADCKACDVFYKDGWGKRCPACQGELTHHLAGERAQEVLTARQSNYEVDFYEKLLRAGRFHASVKVIGALSGRMSGADGLNPQGIKRTDEVRSQFTFADGGLILCGGDFASFEVCLAEAVYNDPKLREDLMTGKSIHGLFGRFLFPDLTYEQIMKSKGTANDFYEKSKRGFFAVLYGGEAHTLNDRIGIPIDIANEALHQFGLKYPKVGEHTAKIYNMFCSMRQPGGIGSKVEWHEPADYIESILGFRRYFTLENKVCKALFHLASDPPKAWREIKIRVQRRDRVQSAHGAAQSALYASAFAIQAANMRAAKNHVIQSSGAQITKIVQRKIWDVQPHGVHKWLVQPLNVHDEIQCPTDPEVVDKVEQVVNNAVESFRSRVPLIKMAWNSHLQTWADK